MGIGLFGCGSGGGGGVTSYFEDGTVTYSVTPVNAVLTSTVGNIPTTADANTVTITPTNTAYAGITRKSPYTIKNIVIRYTKTDEKNFILQEQLNSTPSMVSGGTAAIPLAVATSTIKDSLLTKGFSSSSPWKFYVNAAFTVVEDYSGKSNSYDVQLGTIQFI
jgi:hypothetical protein